MSTSLRQNSRPCLITVWLLLLAGVVAAQITQTRRIEIPMRSGETTDNYAVVSAKNDGLIVYNLFLLNGKSILHVSCLDTTLQEVWTGNIEIENNISPKKAVVRDGVFFMLSKQTTKTDFTLVVLDVKTQHYTIYFIQNYIPFNPSEFISVGDAVMIGGYFNGRPLVIYFSLKTKQTKILPGLFNDQGELLQLRVSGNGTVDVITAGKNADHKKSLWLRNYDVEGTLLKTTLIEPDAGKNLIFGKSLEAEGDDQVVAGVYGKTVQYSRGIFVAHISATSGYTINYYNFADLENFFSYMKASRQKRVKERIVRRKIKGKKVRFNYRFLVQELVPYGNGFVMLGEAFYPTYKTMNGGSSFNLFLSRSNSRDYVFDGYQYTHAVVIGFSKTGELLWDNSFEINDVKTFNLDQYVKLQAAGSHLNLLYVHNDQIRSKIIQDNQVLEGRTTERIKTKFPNDVVSPDFNSKSKLEYWYPGYFYAIGSQRITNSAQLGIPLVRKVFYINKIMDR